MVDAVSWVVSMSLRKRETASCWLYPGKDEPGSVFLLLVFLTAHPLLFNLLRAGSMHRPKWWKMANLHGKEGIYCSEVSVLPPRIKKGKRFTSGIQFSFAHGAGWPWTSFMP